VKNSWDSLIPSGNSRDDLGGECWANENNSS